MLSCLPLATLFNITVSLEPTIFNIKQIDSLSVAGTELQQAIRCDIVLGLVFRYTKSSWPSNLIIILSGFIIVKMNLLLRIIVSHGNLCCHSY